MSRGSCERSLERQSAPEHESPLYRASTIHLVPIGTVHDLDYDRQRVDPPDEKQLDAAHNQILRAMREAGHTPLDP
jgi:hypothetical protein